MSELEKLKKMPELLLQWYDLGRRVLPWREDPSPYHVWVSEIMLQQTRVEAVKPYYDRFMERLPNVEALSGASEEMLLKLWEGLGYYNRVRNMHKAAVMIMENYAGKMPDQVSELIKLPGIGSYTSGAIASIAYNKAVSAVDGNVLRVYTRVAMDERNVSDLKVRKSIEDIFTSIMPQKRAGDFNQALMELGAMVCLPVGKAKCDKCPLQEICSAAREDCVQKYPVKNKKKDRVIEEKTVLVIQTDQKAAFQKRPKRGLLAGMYEFPCMLGKKSKEAVLEYVKQIGFVPIRIRELGEAKHIFTHKEWHMTGFLIQIDDFSPNELVAQKLQYFFVEKNEIEKSYPIPSAYASYTKYLHIKQGADALKEDRK